MTAKEMSDSLDTLLNAYSQNPDFGKDTSLMDIRLDEYEKSVYLTHAQDNIVKNYFQKNTANDGNGFDDSERRQIDYSTLITTNGGENVTSSSKTFDDDSLVFKFPTDVLFVLNEKITIKKSNVKTAEYVVVPINYNDYDRYKSKPYTKPLRKQAWRLLNNDSGKIAEIILKNDLEEDEVATYKMRYVKRPKPILVADFTGMDLTFAGYEAGSDGNYGPQDCELDPIIHRDIVAEAARLAIASRGGRQPQDAGQAYQQRQQQ